MKTYTLATLAVSLLPVTLEAQETTVSKSPFSLEITAAVDAASTYAFRGVDVTDAIALQPWATVTLGTTGLSLTAWGSWVVDDRERPVTYSGSLTRSGTDEIDLTAAFSRAAGPLSLSAGYVAYVYPEQDYTTQEVYAGLAVPSLPLSPALTAFYDFDGADDPSGDPDTVEGAYVSLSAAQRIDAGTALDAAASLGWTNQNALRADPGLNDANVSLAAPLAVGGVTVTPTAGWTRLFDGSPYAAGTDDTFWVRLQVKLSR